MYVWNAVNGPANTFSNLPANQINWSCAINEIKAGIDMGATEIGGRGRDSFVFRANIC